MSNSESGEGLTREGFAAQASERFARETRYAGALEAISTGQHWFGHTDPRAIAEAALRSLLQSQGGR